MSFFLFLGLSLADYVDCESYVSPHTSNLLICQGSQSSRPWAMSTSSSSPPSSGGSSSTARQTSPTPWPPTTSSTSRSVWWRRYTEPRRWWGGWRTPANSSPTTSYSSSLSELSRGTARASWSPSRGSSPETGTPPDQNSCRSPSLPRSAL